MSAVAVAPPVTLQTFTLDDLAPYKREQSFDPGESTDFRTFYVGRDDVHGVLMHLFTRVSHDVLLSMFGYDDDALDAVIEGLIMRDDVYFRGTLDKSQSTGVHEKLILSKWSQAVRADFVIGTTATGQIEHTKGGVLDGKVGFEGSTNWSASGEGTGIGVGGAANIAGFKAQANTLTVFTNPVEIHTFSTRLTEDREAIIQKQLKVAA